MYKKTHMLHNKIATVATGIAIGINANIYKNNNTMIYKLYNMTNSIAVVLHILFYYVKS